MINNYISTLTNNMSIIKDQYILPGLSKAKDAAVAARDYTIQKATELTNDMSVIKDQYVIPGLSKAIDVAAAARDYTIQKTTDVWNNTLEMIKPIKTGHYVSFGLTALGTVFLITIIDIELLPLTIVLPTIGTLMIIRSIVQGIKKDDESKISVNELKKDNTDDTKIILKEKKD